MPKFLIDTHILIWWLEGSSQLSSEVREIMRNGSNAIHLSSGAIWEMSIKQALGRLDVPHDLEQVLRQESIEVLPINASHALAVATLPSHHRDPFDRIQIAQAQLEDMTLISHDGEFGHYDVKLIKA
jgi:PIN domain nuclease of toxin-antitoxin system